MSDLKTTYMGIPLTSPLIVAASTISSLTERIVLAEQAGAGALVIRSLFEEQIQFDALKMEDSLAAGGESFAEAMSYFPKMRHGEADEHVMWVEKARKAVKMPLIASLNAVSPGTWTKYARQLEGTGIDGLELNVYSVETDPRRTAAEIEKDVLETVESVKKEVKLPISVKLSPFYTSMANVATGLDKTGVGALVLFNRFLQPDIDPATEEATSEMAFSRPEEMRLPLRWVAMLHGRIRADLALNTGVHTGTDAAKAILAGATVVQVASALLVNGIPYLSTMLRQLEGWMTEKGYGTLAEFRGKLSQKQIADPLVFERAQYVKLILSQK